MAINPRLQQKITGRLPGEAMQEYGETLGKQTPRDRDSPGTFLSSLNSGRRLVRWSVGMGLAALGVLGYFLFGGRWI